MVLHSGKTLEILPEITSQKRKWQEEYGDDGQLLHALVLKGSHLIEQQVDHAVSGAPHNVEFVNEHEAMVLDVAEVSDGDRADANSGPYWLPFLTVGAGMAFG